MSALAMQYGSIQLSNKNTVTMESSSSRSQLRDIIGFSSIVRSDTLILAGATVCPHAR